jgi:hypothetical protein
MVIGKLRKVYVRKVADFGGTEVRPAATSIPQTLRTQPFLDMSININMNLSTSYSCSNPQNTHQTQWATRSYHCVAKMRHPAIIGLLA